MRTPYTPESSQLTLEPEAILQTFLNQPSDMYTAVLAGSYQAVTAETVLADTLAIERADAAHAVVFAVMSDRPEQLSVADAALTLIKRPAAKWQAVGWLAQQIGGWPDRYDAQLAEAAVQARGNRKQHIAIMQARAEVAVFAKRLVASIMDEPVEVPSAVEQAALDAQCSISGAILTLPLDSEQTIEKPDPDLVLLEPLLRGGQYCEAVACFENTLCFGNDDDIVRMQAAGLMIRYEASGALADMLPLVCQDIDVLIRSEPMQGDGAELSLARLQQQALAIKAINLAHGLVDIRERAKMLLTCRMQVERLGLAVQSHQINGRTLGQLVQAAWTKWAHLLPDDSEREKWAELAGSWGVDIDYRHQVLRQADELV